MPYRHPEKIDPRLREIIEHAAEEWEKQTGQRVEFESGYRSYTGKRGGTGQHTKGQAIDVKIYDENGKAIPNYQSAHAFRAYEKFAQFTRNIQQKLHPELDKIFRWGGYFSGVLGKYGAVDLMHFDINKKLGMAGGTWKKGLTPEQRKLIPHAVSVGIEGQPPVELDLGDGGKVVTAAAGTPRSDIKNLQHKLNRAGFTGVSGNKLAEDGRIGPETENAVRDALNASSKLGEHAPRSQVKAIQAALNLAGIRDVNGNELKEDGIVGPATQSAITRVAGMGGVPPTAESAGNKVGEIFGPRLSGPGTPPPISRLSGPGTPPNRAPEPAATPENLTPEERASLANLGSSAGAQFGPSPQGAANVAPVPIQAPPTGQGAAGSVAFSPHLDIKAPTIAPQIGPVDAQAGAPQIPSASATGVLSSGSQRIPSAEIPQTVNATAQVPTTNFTEPMRLTPGGQEAIDAITERGGTTLGEGEATAGSSNPASVSFKAPDIHLWDQIDPPAALNPQYGPPAPSAAPAPSAYDPLSGGFSHFTDASLQTGGTPSSVAPTTRMRLDQADEARKDAAALVSSTASPFAGQGFSRSGLGDRDQTLDLAPDVSGATVGTHGSSSINPTATTTQGGFEPASGFDDPIIPTETSTAAPAPAVAPSPMSGNPFTSPILAAPPVAPAPQSVPTMGNLPEPTTTLPTPSYAMTGFGGMGLGDLALAPPLAPSPNLEVIEHPPAAPLPSLAQENVADKPVHQAKPIAGQAPDPGGLQQLADALVQAPEHLADFVTHAPAHIFEGVKKLINPQTWAGMVNRFAAPLGFGGFGNSGNTSPPGWMGNSHNDPGGGSNPYGGGFGGGGGYQGGGTYGGSGGGSINQGVGGAYRNR